MPRHPLLLLLAFLCTSARAQHEVLRSTTPLSIELPETSSVAETALYFTGDRNIGYQFGRRITPHGDCIDVVNGYQFVTQYKGSMENRDLMLSRRRDKPGAAWVHLQLPHRHIGFRGDATIGDSHNVAGRYYLEVRNGATVAMRSVVVRQGFHGSAG